MNKFSAWQRLILNRARISPINAPDNLYISLILKCLYLIVIRVNYLQINFYYVFYFTACKDK